MDQAIKIIVVPICVCIALFALLGGFVGSCESPSKEAKCESELRDIRNIAISSWGEEMVGCSLAKWLETRSSGGDGKTIEELFGEYYKEFSLRYGGNVVSFCEKGDVVRMTDPWGQTYNIGRPEQLFGVDLQAVDFEKLKRFMVCGWVLWSSGPNGVNDGGGADDVLEFKMRWVAN